MDLQTLFDQLVTMERAAMDNVRLSSTFENLIKTEAPTPRHPLNFEPHDFQAFFSQN